jgi:hypothetical protein
MTMEIAKKNERGFTCQAIDWDGKGPRLVSDEQLARRYEVRDTRGTVVGFIQADRARSHPHVMWQRQNSDLEILHGQYKTVEAALSAF